MCTDLLDPPLSGFDIFQCYIQSNAFGTKTIHRTAISPWVAIGLTPSMGKIC